LWWRTNLLSFSIFCLRGNGQGRHDRHLLSRSSGRDT
jgi:hypothetical protein